MLLKRHSYLQHLMKSHLLQKEGFLPLLLPLDRPHDMHLAENVHQATKLELNPKLMLHPRFLGMAVKRSSFEPSEDLGNKRRYSIIIVDHRSIRSLNLRVVTFAVAGQDATLPDRVLTKTG